LKVSFSAGIATTVAIALVAGGWLVRPRTIELESARTGDNKLQSYIDQHYKGAGHRLEVVVVGDNSMTFAGRGANEHSPFEIGSISKGFTGLLLANSIHRGEVKLDDQVGTLLPLTGAEVSTATLEDLATHYSGLPRTSTKPFDVARGLLTTLDAGNPYPYNVDDLINQAKADAGGRGEPAYSNVGAALLGQALARKAGKSYPDFLRERLLQPLDLQETHVPTTIEDAAPAGYSSGGRKEQPWIQDGYAPAGGIVSTAGDLSLLAQSMLRGNGVEALAPRRDFEEGDRIGYFWLTSPLTGTDRQMVWHNGGTGGYRSFVGLDLEKKRAVVVLSDVAADVDDFATKLLADQS
jgi:CubicO group peptidase (beta-lactamase class C family)